MNIPPKSNDSNAISKLFQDNDDLGPDSSLFLRCAHMFFREGKPLGQITILTFSSPDKGSFPFGALAHTTKNRIIFWPVVPRDISMVPQKEQVNVFDHLTLEFPSKKIHATAYDVNGNALHTTAFDHGHHEQSWKLQKIEGTGLSLWFSLLVRWDVLRDQDKAVQRRVSVPPTDAVRRKTELELFANKVKVINVPLIIPPSAGNYVYCVAYIVIDMTKDIHLPPDVFQIESIINVVKGYHDIPDLAVIPQKILYEKRQHIFAAMCPPGELIPDVSVGFPRQR